MKTESAVSRYLKVVDKKEGHPICLSCQGIGRTEILLELSSPRLDQNGRAYRFVVRRITCETCSGLGFYHPRLSA